LVKSADGNDSPAIEQGNKINILAIVAKDESIRTMNIMKSDGRAIELKKQIDNYREFLIAFMGNNESSAKIINELLSTSNITDTLYGEAISTTWENSFFPYGAYIVAVLGNLGCIETNVKMAEAEVLFYLSEK
jgi:hypothetical protein